MMSQQTERASAMPAFPEPDEPPAYIRVLVIDGSPFSRVGLSSLLRSAGLDVVGEAGDAVTAAMMAPQVAPDVALMDLDLPGTSGAEAVRLLSASSPLSRVVVITVAAEHPDVMTTLAAGACGCILKDSPTRDVVAAVRSAARGESVVSPPIASRLVHLLRLQLATSGHAPALSPREFEVLDLLTRGWDNARIAAALYVSLGTVKHHISNILSKLGVENRIQAAVRAVQDGLLDERARGGRP
jgi:DNA-binding NarL/FixJ family response regulator